MMWLERHRRTKWDHDSVLEESKKYKFRTKFAKNSSGAYDVARHNNWLDEMVWLKWVPNPYTTNMHCIYGYFDNDNKVAYIGLTMNKIKRNSQHHKSGPRHRNHYASAELYLFIHEQNDQLFFYEVIIYIYI